MDADIQMITVHTVSFSPFWFKLGMKFSLILPGCKQSDTLIACLCWNLPSPPAVRAWNHQMLVWFGVWAEVVKQQIDISWEMGAVWLWLPRRPWSRRGLLGKRHYWGNSAECHTLPCKSILKLKAQLHCHQSFGMRISLLVHAELLAANWSLHSVNMSLTLQGSFVSFFCTDQTRELLWFSSPGNACRGLKTKPGVCNFVLL